MSLEYTIVNYIAITAGLGIVIYVVIQVLQNLRTLWPGEEEDWEGKDPKVENLASGPHWDNDSQNATFLAKAPGNQTLSLMRFYNFQDAIVFRSLLSSIGIENHLSYQRMGSLLPGVRIQGHTDMILSILAEDREDAVSAAQEYLATAREIVDYRQYRWLGIFFGFFFLGYAVPQRTLPELLVNSV
jgi:hypothetical protein